MKPKNKQDKTESPVIIPFKLCICCGKSGWLSPYVFQYCQESPVAKLSTLTSDGTGVILGYFLAKTYTVEALFCPRCGKRLEKAEFTGQLFQLAAVLLVFFTIILCMVIGSWFGLGASVYTLGAGALFIVGFRIWIRYYHWKYSPKIKSIDEKSVVVSIPGKGKTKLLRI